MSVNARVSDTQFTVMMSGQEETELLPIVRWLVGTGVDTSCRNASGRTAAEMGRAKDRTRIQHYLEAQEARQKSRKVKKKEEEKTRAAAAAVSAARVREMEEAVAALLLELEAEEEAAAAKKKKEGKAGDGGRKKKKK
jgi:dTDP-glucose pyrophosphorylase